MSNERFSADDPRQWLSRARSNLSQAKGGIQLPGVYLEDLCFQAQQAAEKSMKGVLIALRAQFPYTHDLAELLSLIVQTGQATPEQILEAAKLSDYAVEARYPGLSEPVTHEEYLDAINIAEAVVNWAEKIVG